MILLKPTTYLFSAAGCAALHGFIDRATLFAFDLDGTLAPIAADPSLIMIAEEVRRGLIRLGQIAPLAIITGRARADARAHLGFEPLFLVGNHGAEGLPDGAGRGDGYVRLCRDWEQQLRLLLPNDRHVGIIVENKGETLSIHYRNLPERERARGVILESIQRLTPLPRLVSGKFVENLLPQDAPNKGEALASIMRRSGCRRSLFVGDDETDEDVFRLRDDHVFGIRVGRDSASAARYFIHEQNEIGPLLAELIESLTRND